MNAPEVFRDKIKEGRKDYFVTYQPADCRYQFAIIQLTFPEISIDDALVTSAMEQEMDYWLKRYVVPVMVTAFDAKDDVIEVRTDSGGPHLMGYFDSSTKRIVKNWKLIRDDALPLEQSSAEYLQHVYHDVGCRNRIDVRNAAEQKSRNTLWAANVILFFVVGVPVLISIISLRVAWVDLLLTLISITVGGYKAAKTFGWVKPSEHEKLKAEKEDKKAHYYYHCEQNPEAFMRLKIENFERQSIEQTRNEAESLGVEKMSTQEIGSSFK